MGRKLLFRFAKFLLCSFISLLLLFSSHLMLCVKSSRLVATCVFLGCCFLVTPMLSVGVSSELSYSNGHKNPKEVSEAVQFTLNRKPKILLQWTPHASHKIKLAVRGDFPKASGDYKWLSSDMRIVYVSSYGKRPGIAIVKTVWNRDPQNFDEILVRVFASHDNVSCDMILEPILNNDQLEPNCILKPNLISMDCIDMTLLVYSPVGDLCRLIVSLSSPPPQIIGLRGVASVLGYTNGHKNPEEISEAVQFTLNIKPKILLQWAPHASHKIKLAVRGGCPKASGDYKWLSPDMGIVAVSSYAVIQVKRPGIAIVKTVSNRDPHNSDEILVRVFASHDNVSDDMIIEPILNNDQLEPNCILKPKRKACLLMMLLIHCLVGWTLVILSHYCCFGGRTGYAKHHKSQCFEKRFRRLPIRRIEAKWL
ncbi:unnamed protein product [Brassica napus]|uniref:(rape) hypothetical protein n=1 Tax=Brassica napus TaxID=3708 RepID=A0A816WUH9_BRANA|nr:unnamed protein product [Brassica napus]